MTSQRDGKMPLGLDVVEGTIQSMRPFESKDYKLFKLFICNRNVYITAKNCKRRDGVIWKQRERSSSSEGHTILLL
jgi:hypothetical protein